MIYRASFRFAFIIALVFASVQVQAAALCTAMPPFSVQQLITLTAGTQVSVMLNEVVDSENVAIGNALDFSVRSNVVVNGKVLIAAGATATGWVKNIKKGCSGKCIEITISVESATAVDGQTINLRSIPHISSASHCNGHSTIINLGTSLTAHVLNDIRING